MWISEIKAPVDYCDWRMRRGERVKIRDCGSTTCKYSWDYDEFDTSDKEEEAKEKAGSGGHGGRGRRGGRGGKGKQGK